MLKNMQVRDELISAVCRSGHSGSTKRATALRFQNTNFLFLNGRFANTGLSMGKNVSFSELMLPQWEKKIL